MSDSILRVTRFTVLARGDSIYSDGAISVEIGDDGGGEYMALESSDGRVKVDFDEWLHICKAVDLLMHDASLSAADEGAQ